jgi:hypothetical protein
LLFVACSELSNDKRRCKEINFVSWHRGQFGTLSLSLCLSLLVCLRRLSIWELLYEHVTSKSTVPCILRAFFHDACPLYEYLRFCLHFFTDFKFILILSPLPSHVSNFFMNVERQLCGEMSLMKVTSERSACVGCVCVYIYIYIFIYLFIYSRVLSSTRSRC